MDFSFLTPEAVQLLLSLGLGLALLSLALGAGLYAWARDPVSRRLETLAGGGRADKKAQGFSLVLGRALMGVVGRLAALGRPSQAREVGRARHELGAAGFRSASAANVFFALKVAAALLLPAAAYFPAQWRLSGALLYLVLAAAAYLGLMLPGMFLKSLIKSRREKVVKELPDVIDLLIICVEAGLGLDAAIKRASMELAHACPILAGELDLVSLELKAGVARSQALQNLGQRLQVDDVQSLVAMLNQADRFGVSIGRSLKVHADSLRTKRRQRLEEMAAKIPLKLLFPVLFLIFPAIMVVMAGPAVIRVTEDMFK